MFLRNDVAEIIVFKVSSEILEINFKHSSLKSFPQTIKSKATDPAQDFILCSLWLRREKSFLVFMSLGNFHSFYSLFVLINSFENDAFCRQRKRLIKSSWWESDERNHGRKKLKCFLIFNYITLYDVACALLFHLLVSLSSSLFSFNLISFGAKAEGQQNLLRN